MRFLIFSLACMMFFQDASSQVIDLYNYEKAIYSQNGEDGVIEEFFSIVTPKSRFCVEFGAFDGYSISNTYNLRKNNNWTALLMDASYENSSINLQKEHITAENINDLFSKYNVPYDLDFISIDIDFNDFYVWRALDEKYKPSLVVIEFNCSLGPNDDKTVVYDPNYYHDGTDYHGASITALYLLARSKGYSLIHCDCHGVNCFFARDEILNELSAKGITFKNANNPQALYRYFSPFLPHDKLNRPFTSAREILKK